MPSDETGQQVSPIMSARSGMSSSFSLDFNFLFRFLSSRFFLENRSSSCREKNSQNKNSEFIHLGI